MNKTREHLKKSKGVKFKNRKIIAFDIASI